MECFQNAIAADSRSSLGYAGLADALSVLVDYGLMHPSDGMPRRAKSAAARAIALDSQLGEPYASLGLIRGLYEWEWDAAERLYLRAIELNPGYATAHHWLGTDHYAILGKFDQAMVEIEIAAQLDPLSSIIRENRAYTLMLMRRYDEAIAGYCDLVAFDPTFYRGYTAMGRCYALMGRYSEAIAMLESADGLLPEISRMCWPPWRRSMPWPATSAVRANCSTTTLLSRGARAMSRTRVRHRSHRARRKRTRARLAGERLPGPRSADVQHQGASGLRSAARRAALRKPVAADAPGPVG